jgi:hypothetical protein
MCWIFFFVLFYLSIVLFLSMFLLTRNLFLSCIIISSPKCLHVMLRCTVLYCTKKSCALELFSLSVSRKWRVRVLLSLLLLIIFSCFDIQPLLVREPIKNLFFIYLISQPFHYKIDFFVSIDFFLRTTDL